ncbi:MAG: hypothetical protein CSB55_03335 [Candidatus Cloacimonadota bacterium]|nr:MAG: hypothetical protein CSB55_03335 [Candidatus Cloacimonadota bacterium]
MKKGFKFFFVLLILIGCGKRKNVTGGPKDKIRPEIINILPSEFSAVDSTDIEITFSKPMKHSSLANGLRIYPEIANYKISWIDPNVLLLKIKENLPDTLNYFFEFNENIKGYHNNKLDQTYNFVFTGGKLQDYSIRGDIIFEDKNDFGKEINLSLFAHDSTLIYSKTTKTNKILLTELNKDSYFLEAYIDKNKNNKYTYGSDPYFRRKIEADSLDKFLIFNLAYVDTVAPLLKTAKIINENQLELIFNEKIASVGDISVNSSDSAKINKKVIRSEIIDEKCFILCDFLDSLKYSVKCRDITDKKGNIADSLIAEAEGYAVVDTLAPEVVEFSIKDGSTVTESKPIIKIEFSEVMLKNFIDIKFSEIESGKKINFDYIGKAGKTIKISPRKSLRNFMSYEISVSDKTRDFKGNRLSEKATTEFIVILK